MSSGITSARARIGCSVLASRELMQLFPQKKRWPRRRLRRGTALDKGPTPYAGLTAPELRLSRVDSRKSDCPRLRQGGPQRVRRLRLRDQRGRPELGAAVARRG